MSILVSLDGILRLDDYAKRLVEQGQVAGAITDHGQMSSCLKWYHLAKSYGLKPIIGCEFYIVDKPIEEVRNTAYKTRYHLTLLAKNNDGYKNLCKLMYYSNRDNYYYKPLVTHELLEQCTKGIICLSGCASGEVGELLKQDKYEDAKKVVLWLNSIFDDFYLELQLHGHPLFRKKWDVQTKINNYLDKMHEETGIERVITADSHYLNFDDDDIHEVALCIGTASNLSDTNRMSLKDFDLSVPDPKYVIQLFGKSHPDAILNTRKIADMCNVEFELDRYHVPVFKTPHGESDRDYLRFLAFTKGCEKIYHKHVESEEEALKYFSDIEISRLNEELSVIDKLDLNGYTLIIQDFINWGKRQGIRFGAGRGSAAGSFVNYCVSITEIEPIKNNLLFARYLNPGRISFADIDTDIEDTRRNEVVQYLIDTYGSESVVGIATFGTLRAKNAIRDVARVLEYPFEKSLALTKLLPDAAHNGGNQLENYIHSNEPELQDFKHAYETDKDIQKIVDIAIKLEGNIRNHGMHACGLLVSPKPIYEYLPTEKAQAGTMVAQLDMHECEEFGLVKIDLLGLANLSVLTDTLNQISLCASNVAK